jgi:hypothetical protein
MALLEELEPRGSSAELDEAPVVGEGGAEAQSQ